MGLAVSRDCFSGPNFRPSVHSAPRTSQLGSISSTKIRVRPGLDTAGRSEISSLRSFLTGGKRGEAHMRTAPMCVSVREGGAGPHLTPIFLTKKC